MTAKLDTTIREIVAADFRSAKIFQRHGLDFCCNGSQTIQEGCDVAGADADVVIRELDGLLGTPVAGVPRFDAWDARTLIAYIVGNHHAYVRDALPVLLRHTEKVASVHGRNQPELVHIARLFARVAAEMTEHMMKEERVLFPFIAAMEEASRAGQPRPAALFGTVANPIHMMETEHQFVGDAMAEIRHLTGGYRPPDHACATYRVCLQELDAFEQDLHNHVHLENNLLFPKATVLERA
jgi:regulator of cell morphogenesis and NO signaling